MAQHLGLVVAWAMWFSVTSTTPYAEGMTMAGREVESERDNQRCIVENVPRPRGANTVLATLTVALQAQGEGVTYEDIMGLSSRAFRLQFSWCPSAPHSYIGFNTFDPALKGVGYEATHHPGEFHFRDPKREVTEEELAATHAAVKASIKAGVPVLIGSEESTVVVGYEPVSDENPTGWLRRPGPLPPPPKDDEPYVRPVKQLPWGVCTLKKSTPLPRREAVLWSLKTAVDNAQRGTVAGTQLATGFAAWEKWIKELSEFDSVLERTRQGLAARGRKDDPMSSLCLGNAWCYESLIDARQAAAKYLKSVSGEFGEETAEHLRAAAAEYEQLVTALLEDAECFTHIAPYPWMKDRDWTQTMRTAQAKRLRKALIHERAAITEIEKTLAAEGVDVASLTATGERSAGNRTENSPNAMKDEQNRLLRWQNIFGWSLEACKEGAAKHPEVVEINNMEKTLAPLSPSAENIRKEMLKLEPATLDYWRRVEAIVRAIADGNKVTIQNSGWPARRKEIGLRIKALEYWVAGRRPEEAAEQDFAETLRSLSAALGKPDEIKTRLVKLALQQMKDGKIREADAAPLKRSEPLKELVYRIEHLDAPLWSYDLNFELLLRGIGTGKALGKYNEKGGPFCWVTGNPEDKPKIEAAIKALNTWLQGEESDHEFPKLLKKAQRRDETVWLVRSLLVYLKNHDENYYGLAEKQSGVVLDNVERVFNELFKQWEKGEGTPWSERSDSYMYLTCMRVAGWDADYADVITLSGYGPSFGYSQEKWGAHYHPPPGRDERIGDATGFGFQWEQKKTPEDYWESLKQVIDSGRPVYAPYMEGVLFIGYRDAERPDDRQVRPLARVFVEPGSWWTWEQFCDWHKKHSEGGWFGRHTGKVKTIPPKDSAIDVLRLIVQMATDDPRSHMERFDGVTWGLPGILAYADDLADMSKSGAKEGEGGYFQGGWRGCHNIYPQMSGRPAAATYLKRIAPLFEADAKRHILAAAEAYDRATDAWREFERQLGRPLGDKHNDAWQDPAHRKAGAAAVRTAHDHEKVAIAEIEKALRAVAVQGE